MDTKTNILFAVMLTLIVISACLVYYRTMVVQHYPVVHGVPE